MNYQHRISKVIAYIGQHLDEEITLDTLSKTFHISKFHFHRLFTALTGLSLQQYIRWLRLKRAAHQLIVDKDQSILSIAIDAGFDSHEAFTRVFKKTFGMSPSQYRLGSSGRPHIEKPPYRLPQRGENTMHVEIRTNQPIRLAMIEHRGDPEMVGDSVNQLITWAKAQSINLKPKAGDAFAFGYDDPKTTPPEQFRLDLGIRVPDNFVIVGMKEKVIPAGRYAVAVHKGSRENLADTIYPMYREWLPQSGEELRDFPCIFCYYNFDHEVAQTELITEIWILLK